MPARVVSDVPGARAPALRARADPRRRSTSRCRGRRASSCTGASARRWKPCTRPTWSRTSPSSRTTSHAAGSAKAIELRLARRATRASRCSPTRRRCACTSWRSPRSRAGRPRQRCALLLALGEAQARRGDDVRAKATFLYAADVARAAGESELLARATAGYGGRFLWSHGLTDDRLVPLLEEGISVVGTADSALRVRLLSRLAAALRHGPTRARREVLMEEAIQMARRIGDPVDDRVRADRGRVGAARAAHRRRAAGQRGRDRRARDRRRRPRAALRRPRARVLGLVGGRRPRPAGAGAGRDDARRERAAPARAAVDAVRGARDVVALTAGALRRGARADAARREIGGPALAWNAGAARILQRFLLCCARVGSTPTWPRCATTSRPSLRRSCTAPCSRTATRGSAGSRRRRR